MALLLSRHVAVLIALWCGAMAMTQFRPLGDVDVFWQVQLGEQAWRQGQLVTRDSFTYSHAGEPVPTIGWLAQLLLAGVYHLGAWGGVHASCMALYATAFCLAGWTAVSRRGDEPLSSFCLMSAVLLGWFVSLGNVDVRPQAFALLCLALTLWIAAGHAPLGVRVAGMIPVALLWQNCHPSVLIGAAVLGARAVGAAWQSDRKQAVALGILAAVLGFAQFVTPMGGEILELSAANARVARDVLQVSEWMPAWHPAVRGALVAFWIVLVASAVAVVKLGRRAGLGEVLTFVGLAVMSLSAARFAIFFGLVMVPVWARWFEALRPRGQLRWTGRRAIRLAPLGAWTLLCCGVGLSHAVTRDSIIDPSFPMAGVAKLREALPVGRVYNFREWGGPLIAAAGGRWQVAIDGRLYLFGEAEWAEYHKAALGELPLADLVFRHRPDAFFLRPSYHRGLIVQLESASEWSKYYEDDACIIFLPSSASADAMY